MVLVIGATSACTSARPTDSAKQDDFKRDLQLASATTMDLAAPKVNEALLTSLETGVVDGFDNTPLFAFATSWYQAAHHLNVSRHSYQPGIVVYSKTWLDGLPADLQHILTTIPTEITTDGREQVRRMDPILIRNLARSGISVHEPSAAEREAFAKIGRPVQAAAAQRGGAQARALLKALLAR